ncbi:hypothetical protein WA1_04115 [Scytonema hofmannii PCC 7110]|uniref:DUF4168 domain-containing protein n=1 Tax=Scytonema hofmannii PCC 7110 TaxID=128403 RepID=A0A139WZ35_9CYAN|nr:hypothetical protein [Scytonema hofmannii]KYC37711.1 hypothetical protein WA1_04115 [Scytonema hofmannii PCC 7110]
MYLRKLFLICTASSLGLFLAPLKTNADTISDYYRQSNFAATLVQIERWNSYTPRQKQLSRKIGEIANAYYQKTGKHLPITTQSIRIIMKSLSANPEEAAFIRDRMMANSNAQAVIPRVDRLINRTRNFLGCLNTGGSGCIP